MQVFYELETETLVLLEDGKARFGRADRPRELTSVYRKELAIHKKKVYIVDSVKAGSGHSVYDDALKPVLQFLGVKHEHIPTTSGDSIAQFAESLGDSADSLVVFVSGDTSVNEFVNGLSSGTGHISILVIPAGTGNSLALSVGLDDQVKALRKLCTFTTNDVRTLNVYSAKFPMSFKLSPNGTKKEVTEMLFLVVASWCFHAALVADSDTEELRSYGIERFRMAAESNLAKPQDYHGSYTVNGKKHNGPFAYFVVTPSKRFEPTFEILPKGNIFDPSLYVVSFPFEKSDGYIMDIMTQVYNSGSHVNDPRVTYTRVEPQETIALETHDEKTRFCIDGAIVVAPKDAKIDISHYGNKVRGWSLYIIS